MWRLLTNDGGDDSHSDDDIAEAEGEGEGEGVYAWQETLHEMDEEEDGEDDEEEEKEDEEQQQQKTDATFWLSLAKCPGNTTTRRAQLELHAPS